MDSDDDDLTFSHEYRASEDEMLIPAKEADFRKFLCTSGAAEEVVRLLVGLAEAPEKPDDPAAFLRAKFDAQELPEMVAGRSRVDIPALIAENETLHARATELTAQVEDAVARLQEVEGATHGGLVDALLAGGAFASDDVEGALDAAKLYATVSARFPAPAEEGEAAEEGAPAPAPAAWAAEGAAAPSGALTAESLRAWAKDSFGYGAALAAAHGGLTLQALSSAATDEAAVDEATAAGLYEACVALTQYSEESKAAAAAAAAAALEAE